MSFFKKTKNKPSRIYKVNQPFYRRRRWKFFFVILALLVISIGSLAFYVLSTGSKIFENGWGGISLVKSLVGNNSGTLKGEKDDRINLLLTGMGGPNHPGGYLTDSLMVLSVKPKEKTVAMLSIPRDLLAPIQNHGEDKINSAFTDGYTDFFNKNCTKKNSSQCTKDAMTAGANLSSQTVSTVTGLTIHYYINVEFGGFEKIIDQLGGIDINVSKAIYDSNFPSDDMVHTTTFKISAGPHHIDGKTALKYARSRESTSDFDRSSRQQQILVAVKEKAAQINFFSNPTKILSIFNSLTDSLHTNFSPAEIKSFIDIIKGVDKNNIISKVLTNGPSGQLVDYNNGTYYLKPKTGNFKEIQDLAAHIFETKKDISLEVSNGAKLTTSQFDSIVTNFKNDSKANFTVTNAGAKSVIAQTIIYDYSDGSKNDVLQYLKTKFSAQVISKTKSSTSVIDFGVVVGKNFSAD